MNEHHNGKKRKVLSIEEERNHLIHFSHFALKISNLSFLKHGNRWSKLVSSLSIAQSLGLSTPTNEEERSNNDKISEYNLWSIIKNLDYTPLNAYGNENLEHLWTLEQTNKMQNNAKVKFLLTYALCISEYDKFYG
ncbi:hypothetical protein VNO77_21713 [Canavalia gladiata]|uniref:Uncharacterized protein n=1 Tax=Canavalia gladiata TaxID=3824 RepID=A0AAN9L1Q6_CANGL